MPGVTVPVIPMCKPCFGVSPPPECVPRQPQHGVCTGFLINATVSRFDPDGVLLEHMQIPCNCAANDHIGVTA